MEVVLIATQQEIIGRCQQTVILAMTTAVTTGNMTGNRNMAGNGNARTALWGWRGNLEVKTEQISGMLQR